MNLSVPVIRQDKGSSDCGPASIAMILKYYGIKKSIEEIKKEVEVFPGVGTYMPQLGMYFLSNNFEVKLVTMNPHLFNKSFTNASQKKILAHLENKHAEAIQPERKICIQFFIDYLKAGGKIVVKTPSREDIQTELKHKRPLISLLTTQVLHKKKIGFNFHYNVIIGMDRQTISVCDPGIGSFGGKHIYTIDDYFYALFASAYGEADNASLLKIHHTK